MIRRILIDAAHSDEVRIALASDSKLEEFDFENSSKKQIKSNIYLGKITRVEPSLQAVFVEYGGNKQGFLPFSEVHFDYYQIPVDDKEKILKAIEDEESSQEQKREKRQAENAESGDKSPESDSNKSKNADANSADKEKSEKKPRRKAPAKKASNKPDENQEANIKNAPETKPANKATATSDEPKKAPAKEPAKAQDKAQNNAPEAPKKTKAQDKSPEKSTTPTKKTSDDKPITSKAMALSDGSETAIIAEETLSPIVPTKATEIDAKIEIASPKDKKSPAKSPTKAQNKAPETKNEQSPIKAPVKEEAKNKTDNDSNDLSDNSEGESEEVETVAEEEVFEGRINRSNIYRRYNVQEVLKRGQIVLVQVIKEERGNKGASLTTYMSLAGRYCVLMPNTDRSGGVSRRITDISARKKLKNIVSGLETDKGESVIVRTAGVDRKDTEIKKDFEYLKKTWEAIKKQTLDSEAPALVHEEGSLIKRSLRDIYRENVNEILIEGEDAYNTAINFIKSIAPDSVKKISQYTDPVPIFKNFEIDKQLDDLYDHTATLPSGGSIVFSPTEALVAIDVNSGRATKEKCIEDTALKTNLEAAKEVARQLRLRDLAGLVVIDFIDMRELRNRRTIERALKDALKTDRAKIQVGRISSFGLLEMSRQRMRSSIVEASTKSCPRCKGIGLIRSNESSSITILRAIEVEATKGESEIKLRTSIDSAFYLLNNKKTEILQIEQSNNIKILIEHDYSLIGEEFVIDKPRNRRRKQTNNKPHNNKMQGQKKHSGKKPYQKNQPHNKDETKQDSPNNEGNDSNKPRSNNERANNKRRNSKKPRYDNKPPSDGNFNKSPETPNDVSGNLNSDTKKPSEDKSGSKSASTEEKPKSKDSSKLKGLWKKITQ